MNDKKSALNLSWVHTGRNVGSRPFPVPHSDDTVQTNVCITMDDGVVLRGDLYIPTHVEAPFPAIVEITPYGAQTLAPEGRTYASRGFLFLAVDCRGRYRSEGEWTPLAYDRSDGHQVLRWLEAHRLCNGNIGTRGHSYCGYNQLLMAIDAPDSLKAMAVGVAPGDPFYNTPFQGGAYDLNDLFWLLDMNGRVSSEDKDDKKGKFDEEDEDDEEDEEDEEDTPEEKEHDALLDYALSARPFTDVDLRLGIYHPHFREWVSHWQLDDYWRARSVLPHVDRINVPTLHISGLWDGNGRGATLFYETFRHGKGCHSAAQKLLLGPWNHDLEAPDCDDLPESEMDAIERAAMRDSMNEEMAWFDHHLLGLPLGTSMEKRVEVFLTGINRWFKFDDWPIPGAERLGFYLSNEGGKRRLALSSPAGEDSVSYRFDPLNPTPYGHEDTDAERMPFDNSQIQKERKDILLFDTVPVKDQPVALVGPVRARIFASADAADYDIVVSIYDVYPDGRSIFLTDGMLRARFQESYETPGPVPPGEIREFDIDAWHIAHVLQRGHRLRLQIASGSHLRFDVNGCTGNDLASDTQTRTARVTIHFGASRPSRIEVDRVAQADLTV